MSSHSANISRAYNFPEQVQTVARFVEFVQESNHVQGIAKAEKSRRSGHA
jgi:hypothetical protein